MRINALGNTATDFARDDYIALDGSTNGSRKMKNEHLLEKTAQNAKDVWGNSIIDDIDIIYNKSSKSVVIDSSSSPKTINYKQLVKAGKRIKIHFSTTTWATSSVSPSQRMMYITTRDGDAGSAVVETIAEVSVSAGSVASDYEYTFTTNANNLYITLRGNSGASVSFDVSVIDIELENVKENLGDVKNLSELSFSKKDYTKSIPASNVISEKIPLVPIKGAIFKIHFSTTTWATSSVSPSQRMMYITTRDGDAGSAVVETIAEVNVSAGSVASDYEYTFTTNANNLYITLRGNSGASVSFSVELLSSVVYRQWGKIEDVEKVSINPNYSLFEQGSIDYSTGKNATSNDRVRSDFIEVNGEFDVAMISPYNGYVVLYDSYKNYVSYDTIVGTKHYNHTGYIRLRIQKYSTSPLPIASVDFTQISYPLPDTMPFNIVNKLNEDSANDMRSVNVWERLDLLCVKYSNYIAKTFLCNETSGLPIYYYTMGSGAKKVAIVSGQHGPKSDPRDSVITLCRFIKDFCENKFNSDIGKLKDDCTFLIFPCLNPYGFDNYNAIVDDADNTSGGRKNANGVNLNRDWHNFTQIETQSAKVVLDAFAPDIVIDLHCTGNFPSTNDSITGTQWCEIGYNGNMITTDFLSVIDAKHLVDYSINVIAGGTIQPDSGTLGSYGMYDLLACSSTIEVQWFVKGINQLHDAQVESANYSLLINGLKFMLCKKFGENYSYERTLPQLKA